MAIGDLFTCAKCNTCKKVYTGDNKHCPEYGTMGNGAKVCWDCCGKIDRQDMIDSRKATLYLTMGPKPEPGHGLRGYTVSNWPGTLKFTVARYWTGKHNWARVVHFVEFVGPDGYWWHGRQYGNNTQICHCKRTKEKATGVVAGILKQEQ